MFYIDYILYMHMGFVIEENTQEDGESKNTSKENSHEGNSTRNLTTGYFSAIVNNLKYKLELKGCTLEEEILVKYIFFLVYTNVLPNFLAPDVNRKFYKIFDYLKLTESTAGIPLKRLVIWGYRILLSSTKNREWSSYCTLSEEECDAEIEKILETANNKDNLIPTQQREEHLQAFRRELVEETQKIYRDLNLPLLCTIERTDGAKRIVEEVASARGMMLYSNSATLNEIEMLKEEMEEFGEPLKRERPYTARLRPSQKKRTILEEKYKSIKIDSLLNSEVKGVEVEWNESTVEESTKRPTKKEQKPKLSLNKPEGDASTKRTKKIWLNTDTQKLIKAISIHGRSWDLVLDMCKFDSISKEQVIEKYKSLVKSNKIDRIPR